ncbi:helix-turn-helix domain-containing protein [Staphylococcus agnetis]|uniref:helix-turn-helix domain-containing protein n=1 Tax=Staphylococcus agnetis TaxID=985762 RepID=UPI003BAB4AFE
MLLFKYKPVKQYILTREQEGSAIMFLTVKEVSELLRLNEHHTYKLIRQKEIPSIRLGGKILIPKESLMQMLKQKEA